jgi:hypothetical protein
VPAVQRDHTGAFTWRPESPTLFDADVVLRAGDLTDTVHSYVGFRRVSVRDNRFILNHNPYYQRLVLEQGYWPDSHLAAPDADALKREVELIKELGFTGLRLHQKIEDPRFLYWCDRLGLLVWEEMPSPHEFSDLAVDRLTREWAEAVRRDRSHPCVVAWVPLNESWGVPAIATSARQQSLATGLVHLTKALDPTRPVISNDGWEHTESDILTSHDYTPDGAALRDHYGDAEAQRRVVESTVALGRRLIVSDHPHTDRPLIISECGGVSFIPSPDDDWYGYAVAETAEEYRARFDDIVSALIDAPGLAGFCYTQLTDTLQETNGLLTAEREPKLPVEVIREIVSRPARSIPGEFVAAHRRRARRQ